jgi:hypothetical protein
VRGMLDTLTPQFRLRDSLKTSHGRTLPSAWTTILLIPARQGTRLSGRRWLKGDPVRMSTSEFCRRCTRSSRKRPSSETESWRKRAFGAPRPCGTNRRTLTRGIPRFLANLRTAPNFSAFGFIGTKLTWQLILAFWLASSERIRAW